MADRLAMDGLIARVGGAYALLKHGWMDAYLAAGLNATATKQDRVYIDLFAGPGVSIEKSSGEETLGGALRALVASGPGKADRPAFTEAHFVNLDSRHADALRTRAQRVQGCRVPESRIHHYDGDANVLVSEVMQKVPQRGYAFVFADPEHAGQLPWSTISKLAAQGHKSVDLYLLYPWGIDLRRNAGSNPQVLDAFFGTQEWRKIYKRYPTDSQRVERAGALRSHYLDRLRTLWNYSTQAIKVNLRGDQNLYYMLFATNHSVGIKIAEGVTVAIDKKSEQITML